MNATDLELLWQEIKARLHFHFLEWKLAQLPELSRHTAPSPCTAGAHSSLATALEQKSPIQRLNLPGQSTPPSGSWKDLEEVEVSFCTLPTDLVSAWGVRNLESPVLTWLSPGTAAIQYWDVHCSLCQALREGIRAPSRAPACLTGVSPPHQGEQMSLQCCLQSPIDVVLYSPQSRVAAPEVQRLWV